MKLRMYLRGLALGIIVTAVVLSIGNANKAKDLSDTEIKAKAKALGMVDPEDGMIADDFKEETTPADGVDENVEYANIPEEAEALESQDDVTETEVEESQEEEAEAEAEESQEETAEVEAVESQEEATETEVEEKQEEELPGLEKEVLEQKEETKKELEKIAEDTKEPLLTSTCTITISRGNGSDTVARLLEKAGAVKSATDFDKYLCERKLDKKISVGKYDIPSGADYETIAKIITNSK